MNILITTFGTRGDIQPFIALGVGLKAAGYNVGICTAEGFKPFVEENGVEYVFMNNDLLELSQAALGEKSGMGDTLNTLRQMMPAIRRSMLDEWNAAQTFQPDLIIYHPKAMGSFHVAEKLDIPAILALPLPLYTPTREFPVPFMSNIQLGAWFNHFSYRLLAFLPSAMYGGVINDYRQNTLGLPTTSRSSDFMTRANGDPVPVMYPYSAHVLPVPKDFPPHVHVTGYWFLDHAADWQPDTDLLRFLEAGTPPVYVGFGSMGGRKGLERARIVLDALEKSGQRGLLISGWGGLKTSDLPENVFLAESIPHNWLLPRMAAVVHHGGAGTTAAGLRAGKPAIICPFLGDQPFWGKLVYERGVGTKPIPQGRLTVDALAEAITTVVNDDGMKQRAAELGEKIRAEDGIARAVEIVGVTVGQPV